MIAKITRAYVRRYRDNGQCTVYVEWIDTRGKAGRTEGTAVRTNACFQLSTHMAALMRRAEREGVKIEQEIWGND